MSRVLCFEYKQGYLLASNLLFVLHEMVTKHTNNFFYQKRKVGNRQLNGLAYNSMV